MSEHTHVLLHERADKTSLKIGVYMYMVLLSRRHTGQYSDTRMKVRIAPEPRALPGQSDKALHSEACVTEIKNSTLFVAVTEP